ncbi:MAG TPA: hypothetical protein VM345_00335 [Acidimicrobiales bacterium]|nr:hypothetical protein [Acidimicrobiales bacterium]
MHAATVEVWRGRQRTRCAAVVEGTLVVARHPARSSVHLVVEATLELDPRPTVRNVAFEFRSSSMSGDARAGVVRGELSTGTSRRRVEFDVEFAGAVVDSLGRGHAIFNGDVPVDALVPGRREWLHLDVDFVLHTSG